MGSEKKPLPLRVLPCSRQDGKVRYPNKEDVETPSIAMFRNNLTALSQYRNLLFVAYVDSVYVYTPSFPEQTITTKPELIIDLPRSRLDLRGYLDPSRPHAVNHLIVGDMGDEEVVVVACDDGDVISYTVRSISLAIDEGAKSVFGFDLCEDQKLRHYNQSGWANFILPALDPHRTPRFRTLAPWFHENVGASAWGLATHKATRLLAVSSNLKEIMIFAPSLSSDRNQTFRSADSSPSTMEKYTAWDKWKSFAFTDRFLGRKVTLRGHAANIPNIAFCDNSLDPEGRYLASTDIDGYTIAWDIRDATRVLETLGNAGPHARGWAVACLDPRTSRLSEGFVNTFGCACHADESNTLIDNSEAGESVHNNLQWHPGFSPSGSVPGMLPPGTLPPTQQTAIQASEATTPDEGPEDDIEAMEAGEDEMDDDDNLDDASDDDALNEGEDPTVTAFETHPSNQIPPTLEAAEGEPLLSNEDSDLPDLEEIPVADQISQQMTEAAEQDLRILFPALIGRLSDTTHTKTRSFTDLPFNLLQTDEKDIHLFRDIRFAAGPERRPSDSSHSLVLCQQALNQKIPPGFHYLSRMERLNMIAQIPELGVVVIGNQVGRVGILTMTRWEAQKQSGYKIECILPFKAEEEKGLRPRRLLMGMAVGPIQGQATPLPEGSPRMGAQAPRRFRLLMTYCDHTILSYEISRPDGEENILVV